MIRSFKKMQGIHIRALDGEIGKLKDIYFDDRSWEIRYFVAELGSWISERNVLVSPAVISAFDGAVLNVELTKHELRACPHADSAIPVSLQRKYAERSIFELVCCAGSLINSGPIIVPPVENATDTISNENPHLRSCSKVTNYSLATWDGNIGITGDLLIDDHLWIIRFIAASIDNTCDSQVKLIEPQFIESIDHQESKVKLMISRYTALAKPLFDASKHIDISYEALIKDIFNKSKENCFISTGRV
jgi:hypothetical protein